MNINKRLEEIKNNLFQLKGRVFDNVSCLTKEIKKLSIIRIGKSNEISVFVAHKTENKLLKQRYKCIYDNCGCSLEITTNHCGDNSNKHKLIVEGIYSSFSHFHGFETLPPKKIKNIIPVEKKKNIINLSENSVPSQQIRLIEEVDSSLNAFHNLRRSTNDDKYNNQICSLIQSIKDNGKFSYQYVKDENDNFIGIN